MIYTDIPMLDIREVLNFDMTQLEHIIDVRNVYEYEDFHIQDSINIHILDLINNPKAYLQKNETYYLVCNYGHRSSDATRVLQKLGYNVYLLRGGLSQYRFLIKN